MRKAGNMESEDLLTWSSQWKVESWRLAVGSGRLVSEQLAVGSCK